VDRAIHEVEKTAGRQISYNATDVSTAGTASQTTRPRTDDNDGNKSSSQSIYKVAWWRNGFVSDLGWEVVDFGFDGQVRSSGYYLDGWLSVDR